jgi:replicative DNA helicase
MKTDMKDSASQNERTILSGFENIDKLTCGWHKADLILVAGRPAMGKTAFAVSMANQMTECMGYSVAFFTLELSKTVLLERLENVGNPVLNTQLYIEDNLDFTITDIIECARTCVAEQKVQCIIIDYLQLIVAAENTFTSRKDELSQILQSLKTLAAKLDVPIIVLSQLPRSVEQREDKRPILEDLRDIDTQSVDTVILLYRPGYYHLSSGDNRNIAKMIIAKDNHGNAGVAELRFIEETIKFKDY